MEGKIKKNLGETENNNYVIDQERARNPEVEGEQQMFETFVKEKTTLLGYVHDLIRFAAKLQALDLALTNILPHTSEEIRIKNNRECCIIAVRVGLVVSLI